MATIPGCLIDTNFARALWALALASDPTISKGDFRFICPGCGQPVAPVHHEDHFEHLKENPECPLVLGYVQVWQPPVAKS